MRQDQPPNPRPALAKRISRRASMALRQLAEITSDLICQCDASGNYLYVSPSYVRFAAEDGADLLGKSAYDFIHPEDSPALHAEIERQLQTGEGCRVIEIRKRSRSGDYVWMSAKVHVLIDPLTGAKCGTVTVARDITLERHEREERRKSEERFRSIADLSSDWYWETDEADRFTYISDGLVRILGISPQDMLGTRRTEIAEGLNQAELDAYQAKLRKRESFKDLPFSTRNPLTGAPFYAALSGTPMHENGRFKGYRGIGRDVTEEKSLLQQYGRLADENQALIENSPDAMLLIDRSGRILRANRAVRDIMGYAPHELIGHEHLEFVTEETRGQTLAVAAAVLTDRTVVPEFENCWTRKDGTRVYLSWALRQLKDDTLTYATVRDITEAYQTRTELNRVNQKLNSVLESIGDAFFSVDRNWRVTYANEKILAFAGVTRESAVGGLLWEVIPDVAEAPKLSLYRQALQTQTNIFTEEFHRPSGSWIDIRIYPHDDGLSVFFHDITKRREAERAIRESEERFREIIAITPTGYINIGKHGTVLEVNPAMCEMTGYAREEIIGRHIREFSPASLMSEALNTAAGASFSHSEEAVIQHKQGHAIYALVNLSVKRDAAGNAIALTAFVTDITQRKQAESQLEQLATHDTLTGLPNRALINKRLQTMLVTARPEQSIAVMFIDLDRFKEVNDSMGHAQGDILLRQVAHRLQKNMRPSDIVARLGGDEFVVAAHCSDGRASAEVIARKLMAELANPVDIEGQEVFISASIGVSMFPEDARTKELLFQNADTAMYRAKNAGRNKFCFFEAEMSAEAKTRMTLEHSLRHARERGEFELHFQPRVDLKDGTMVGMEALIRWNHPQLGRIPPLQFIPIAEERGLIEAIGQWVLEEACSRAAHLVKAFGKPLKVSVNVSARQLKSDAFVGQVQEALRKADLSPRLLELELTESALIEDMDESVAVLKRLKELGVLLSVDDFGTGYSGLSYLKRLPVDILKLDRSFVHQQPEGINTVEFVKAFVDMAHALRLSVVAEGIETRDILDLLKESTCDEGQGYFFARPLPVDELEAFFSRCRSSEWKIL